MTPARSSPFTPTREQVRGDPSPGAAPLPQPGWGGVWGVGGASSDPTFCDSRPGLLPSTTHPPPQFPGPLFYWCHEAAVEWV